MVNERCVQRVGTDSKLVRRMPEKPVCFNDYFLVKDYFCSEDANETLIKLGLAHDEE